MKSFLSIFLFSTIVFSSPHGYDLFESFKLSMIDTSFSLENLPSNAPLIEDAKNKFSLAFEVVPKTDQYYSSFESGELVSDLDKVLRLMVWWPHIVGGADDEVYKAAKAFLKKTYRNIFNSENDHKNFYISLNEIEEQSKKKAGYWVRRAFKFGEIETLINLDSVFDKNEGFKNLYNDLVKFTKSPLVTYSFVKWVWQSKKINSSDGNGFNQVKTYYKIEEREHLLSVFQLFDLIGNEIVLGELDKALNYNSFPFKARQDRTKVRFRREVLESPWLFRSALNEFFPPSSTMGSLGSGNRGSSMGREVLSVLKAGALMYKFQTFTSCRFILQ